MGAGKTVLIGTIAATEFALALEYPDARDGPIEGRAGCEAARLQDLEARNPRRIATELLITGGP